jgi:hypothetical protein
MSASFDVAAELAAGVLGREAAWRFIGRFAEHWLVPLAAADGWRHAELHAAEQRLGLRLPAAMWEAYSLFGRRKDLTRTQDRLLGPGELWVDQTATVLVFREENQSVASWGVPLVAVAQADPPVRWRLNDADGAWRPYLERFSLTCVELVLSESLFSSADLLEMGELDPAAAARLGRRFVRLALPDYPLWALPDGPPVRWLAGPDVVVRVDAGTWVSVRARTKAALAAVRAVLADDRVVPPTAG